METAAWQNHAGNARMHKKTACMGRTNPGTDPLAYCPCSPPRKNRSGGLGGLSPQSSDSGRAVPPESSAEDPSAREPLQDRKPGARRISGRSSGRLRTYGEQDGHSRRLRRSRKGTRNAWSRYGGQLAPSGGSDRIHPQQRPACGTLPAPDRL